ncbi:DUF4397 domain-containing protein [Haloglomus litoreum]|uniref:DUF4397 domain-containing protein n=1 Tax=Haloglomus litoreum TaxID=3034026 RepID=UPI0023E835F3|nr:DUF4397 domain-containing protein [Haloglomus sp. DT116]
MPRTTVRSVVTVLIALALVGSAAAGTTIALGTTQEEPTPTEGTPMAETPTGTPAEEAPEETPTEEAPEETPTEEAPEETPTEEAPEETPTEEPTDNVTEGPSYVRALHASPDAPPVDVYVENQTFLTNLSFANVSDYAELAPGTYNLTVTAAGDREAVVFDGAVALEPGAVTIAATGATEPNTLTEFALVGYSDDAPQPAENESALRVLHLSPDAPTVDVTTAGGAVVAENLTFRNASDYVTVPAGNYTAEIRLATASNDGPIVTTANVSLQGGSAYSALALGYVVPDNSSQSFRVGLIEDATTVTENGTTTVRLPGDDGMGEPTPTPEPEGTPTPEPEGTPTAEPEGTPTAEPEATPTEATAAPGTETGMAEDGTPTTA